MTVKPVKFISDVQTKKQIIKTDISGNLVFVVSGTLPDGMVSSSLPISASNLYIDGATFSTDLNISGAALTNLSSTGTIHNVYDVFANIDSVVLPQVLSGTARANTQEIHTGSFEVSGTKDIQLTSYTVSDLDFIYTDVQIKYSGSSNYKNDLIDVELSGNISANKIHVLFTAPALSSTDSYRLVVNRQSGSVII